MTGKQVRVRRVYEEPSAQDGARVLVDRVWPRGLSKDRASLDWWCKQVAPSTELRRWYSHDAARTDEFTRRYLAELSEPERAEALEELRARVRAGPVTLLTASKAVERSQASVLARVLREA